MEERTRRRENCAPLLISLSNECVASKCQAFTPTSIVLHSPSSFSHGHAYLHFPHIRTSTSTPYIIRILHMQAQVGQAWTLCVVWFTVRRARFFFRVNPSSLASAFLSSSPDVALIAPILYTLSSFPMHSALHYVLHYQHLVMYG